MMSKPNARARTEAALRGGRPLLPTAEPAIGDIYVVFGQPFRLAKVTTAGRGSAVRFYTLVNKAGCAVTVQPAPEKRRTA
jgi:hypothetical protein